MPLTPRQTFVGGGTPGGTMPAPHAFTHAAGGADPLTSSAIGAMPASLTVTGYTGGGSENLDGVPTLALSVPQLFSFVHASEGYRVFRLRAGTDVASPNGLLRPLDFDGSTNAKVWEIVS